MPEEPRPEDIGPPHLHDDALNAVLDGEAGADEAAHARACPPCSIRLERFRLVALAGASPVTPVAAEHRRAAVSRAVAVGLGPGWVGAEGEESSAAAGVTVDPVVVLAERPRRRWGRGATWAAAAAGVAALALAVPLLDQFTGLSRGQDTAASSAQENADAGGSTAALGYVDGGDLGDLDRTGFAALVQRLDHDLGPGPLEELAPQTLDQPAESSEAESGGQSSSARGATENAPPPDEPAQPAERCEVAARERNPDHGPLVYVARARFDGVDAVVLGFDTPGSPAGRAAEILVLTARDCTELVSASA